jgi:hypothetical protein
MTFREAAIDGRCPRCGGAQWEAKRSAKNKALGYAALGVGGALAASKDLVECVTCGLRLGRGEPSKPRIDVKDINRFGIQLRVERGHLVIEDGIGRHRRERRFARATHGLRPVGRPLPLVGNVALSTAFFVEVRTLLTMTMPTTPRTIARAPRMAPAVA